MCRHEAYINSAPRSVVPEKKYKLWEEENTYEKLGKTSVCNILKSHHEQLKDDPERLTCDFMKKVIGIGKEC